MTMTDAQACAVSFAGYAREAVARSRRVDLHTASETSLDVADTLATVTPPEEISWAGCYAWAAPAPNADGTIAMQTSTSFEEVRHFYADGKEVFNLKSFGDPMSRLTTPWYGLFEATGHLDVFARGLQLDQDWVLFAPLDGPQGITGEIAWGRFPHREPGADVTDQDRAAVHRRYVEALRAADVDGVLALLSDDVVGAARAYPDRTPAFRPLADRAAFHQYYEELFDSYEVLAVDPVTVLLRGWYVFSELVWQVRPRGGDNLLTFVTGELLVLDTDGRIWAKAGYGTPAEPGD
jgi:SnoaL-like domain